MGKVGKPQPKQRNTDNDATEKELADLRQRLGDTSKPISMKDLNSRLSGKTEQPYRTDTERGMERLRQQLENPRKIDLSKMPKR